MVKTSCLKQKSLNPHQLMMVLVEAGNIHRSCFRGVELVNPSIVRIIRTHLRPDCYSDKQHLDLCFTSLIRVH